MSSESRSSSTSKRRHSKVNIVKQDGINDFLKSLESEIELNRGYLNRSKSSKSSSSSLNKSYNDENDNKLVTQSMINPPTINNTFKSPKVSSSSAVTTTTRKSSLTKSLNFDYNADLSSSSDNNNENTNNGLSIIKPKKRVSVISPKRTPLSTLSLNNNNNSSNYRNTNNSNTSTNLSTLSLNNSSSLNHSTLSNNSSTISSIINNNNSRLSIKDLKDSSTSSSDNEKRPKTSSRRELAKQMEQTHLALEEMINLQQEMKLHIPKELKRDVSKKSEEFKSDCTKVLSKIDVLLSRVVKNLNESREIQKSPKKSKILIKSYLNNSNNNSKTSTPLKSKSSPKYSKYSPNINR